MKIQILILGCKGKKFSLFQARFRRSHGTGFVPPRQAARNQTCAYLRFTGSPRGRGYSHTLPIRVCAAQRGRDFEAPDLERGIHFRGVF